MAPLHPVLFHYIAGLKIHNVSQIAETVADDLVFISATGKLDKEQFLAFLKALYAAFPDWNYDHDEPEWRPDGTIAVKWRQGGTHTGTLALADQAAIGPTGKSVRIPEQYFFYEIVGERITVIRPDPIPGGAPGGILEQIGVSGPR